MPPTCTTPYTFSDLDTSTINLIVPESALEAYRNDSTWGKFNLSVASGVEENISDSDFVNIYDLSGRAILINVHPSSIKATSGIYLIKNISNGNVYKAYIK